LGDFFVQEKGGDMVPEYMKTFAASLILSDTRNFHYASGDITSRSRA